MLCRGLCQGVNTPSSLTACKYFCCILYLCIQRERERERERQRDREVVVYIYVLIYVYIHTHVYIHGVSSKEPSRRMGGLVCDTFVTNLARDTETGGSHAAFHFLYVGFEM